jgi:hypothetical protein
MPSTSRCSWAILLALTGCAGAIRADAGRATASALDVVQAKVPALVQVALGPDSRADIQAIVATGRDELLGPAARAAVQAIVAAARDELLGANTRTAVQTVGATTREALVGSTARADIESIVRAADAQMLRDLQLEVPTLRESLVGTPLRADVDALIDQVTPHLALALQTALQAALQPTLQRAELESTKWKTVAGGFAVGTGLLALALGFTVVLVHRHRQTIERMSRALHDQG